MDSAKPDSAAGWLGLYLGSVYRAGRLGGMTTNGFPSKCLFTGYMGVRWL